MIGVSSGYLKVSNFDDSPNLIIFRFDEDFHPILPISVAFSIKHGWSLSRVPATSTPSAYDQHKVDTGNSKEGNSIEEQRTDPGPTRVNKADIQRAEEQLLNTMNIHGPALRKAHIILYLKEEG